MIATGAVQVAILVGPIALATSIAAVGMHGFQGGWSFAPGALKLHWSRLSPATGMKRFSFSQSGVETIKIAGHRDRHRLLRVDGDRRLPRRQRRSCRGCRPSSRRAPRWTHAEALLWRVGWTLAALALADYGLQRYRWMAGLKMTRQEVRDEARQNEGNGEVKGRIRRMQREMARRRMLSDVAKATVVITNPTHFAVALEYKRDIDGGAARARQGPRPSWRSASRSARASTASRSSRTSRSRRASTSHRGGRRDHSGATLRGGRRSARVSDSHQAVDAVSVHVDDAAIRRNLPRSRSCSRPARCWRSSC